MINQLYDTPAKLEARRQEMFREDTEPLIKKAKKGNAQFNALQSAFGLDLDFSPADLGSERERR